MKPAKKMTKDEIIDAFEKARSAVNEWLNAHNDEPTNGIASQQLTLNKEVICRKKCSCCGHEWENHDPYGYRTTYPYGCYPDADETRKKNNTCPKCGFFFDTREKPDCTHVTLTDRYAVLTPITQRAQLEDYNTNDQDPNDIYAELHRKAVIRRTINDDTQIMIVENQGVFIYKSHQYWRQDKTLTKNTSMDIDSLIEHQRSKLTDDTIRKMFDDNPGFVSFLTKIADTLNPTVVDGLAVNITAMKDSAKDFLSGLQRINSLTLESRKKQKNTDVETKYTSFIPQMNVVDVVNAFENSSDDETASDIHLFQMINKIGKQVFGKFWCAKTKQVTEQTFTEKPEKCPCCGADLKNSALHNMYCDELTSTSRTISFFEVGPDESLLVRSFKIDYNLSAVPSVSDKSKGTTITTTYDEKFRIFFCKDRIRLLTHSISNDNKNAVSNRVPCNGYTHIYQSQYDPAVEWNINPLTDYSAVVARHRWYGYVCTPIQSDDEIKNIIKNTHLRYKGLIEAWHLGDNKAAPETPFSLEQTSYLYKLYSKPILELLIKCGMYQLLTDVRTKSETELRNGGINPRATTIQDAFGLTKQGFTFVRKLAKDVGQAVMIRDLIDIQPDIKEDSIAFFLRLNDGTFLDDLKRFCADNSVTPDKVKEYLENVYGFQCIPAKEAFLIWTDYLRMARYMEMKLDKTSKFPSSLKKEHDKLSFAYTVAAKTENEKLFKQRSVRNKDFEYTPEPDEDGNYEYDFCVRIPEHPNEVINEGSTLHHCVASYVMRITDGETCIAFVRNRLTPDIPYFTMEIRNKTICQLRGMSNKSADDRMLRKFIRHYAHLKKLTVGSI